MIKTLLLNFGFAEDANISYVPIVSRKGYKTPREALIGAAVSFRLKYERDYPLAKCKPCCQTCWSLNNLRPLSSKQNQADGCARARHGKNNQSK